MVRRYRRRRRRSEICLRIRHLPSEKRLSLLIEQCLPDTEAAVSRLFEALPEVHILDLRVLAPASQSPIIEGTVYRSTLNPKRRLISVKMRLIELGLHYRLVGSCFANLYASHDARNASTRASQLGRVE